ncbi:ComEC/Rec2 family competence protein [Saliterribacillus persicus]|uniref:Beta-lactamase superfamily II metal-dependent hydrolase n=1 Tax=Saliterribacillus persicus TaxID=930114 RepID=A0A368X4Q3_9BACI|nr:ComEC/Rec2 family competence protein [Saliterribacillus persicus]RCW62980.1 beta-lactamase superfamily II metal-dependent hydrolase [Saliterribacillus persicus]
MRSFFILLLSLAVMVPVKAEAELKVDFIDIGQGDSILIETPNKEHILIDGGPPDKGKMLLHFLEKRNVEKLDTMIATHPDFDHIGGLIDVIDTLPVEKIMEIDIPHFTKTYLSYKSKRLMKRIPVSNPRMNQAIKLDDGISLTFLNTVEKTRSMNENSIAILLSYGAIDFLLTADITRQEEQRLLKNHQIEAEILKVAHHGSKTSTSYQFLEKVNPSVAVISYEVNNPFGHPVASTITNLIKSGSTVYSTAKVGTITVQTDGKTFNVTYPGKDKVIYNKPS